MACFGVEPGAADWKAQTNPLRYGGTRIVVHLVEHFLHTQEVCSSNTINPLDKQQKDSYKNISLLYRNCASLIELTYNVIGTIIIAQWLLPTPEDMGSNLIIIINFLKYICLLLKRNIPVGKTKAL